MKWMLLALGLAACVYVLLDSNALEFQSTVVSQNDLVERMVMKPVFHRDRLENDLRRRYAAAHDFVARGFGKIGK